MDWLKQATDPGELRNLIEIQALPAKVVRNPDGSVNRATPQWGAFATVYAKIDSTGGKEFQAGRQVNPQLTHELTVWWKAGIVPSQRIKFQDPNNEATRFFDIQAVVNPNNEVRYQLLLHCKELVGREAVT